MPTTAFFLFLSFLLGSLFSALGTFFYFRRQYRFLTQAICNDLDGIISSSYSLQSAELETQSSKIRAKLEAISSFAEYSRKETMLRLQEVQQMVSDISHQLKTPLSNVLLYSDTLEASGELGEEGQHFLSIMQGQLYKLKFLIHSLIKMSRLESHMLVLQTETTPFFPTLSRAISAILPAADKKGLTIQVHCPEQLCLHFDPKWTEEAIFNVLDNAVKYTSSGSITVLVEPWQLYTRISVTDTGIGVDSRHQNDIFKRFYREHRVHHEEGVGIGLYLTREILERQGGYITVSSSPGKGSCFSLFLPNKKTLQN